MVNSRRRKDECTTADVQQLQRERAAKRADEKEIRQRLNVLRCRQHRKRKQERFSMRPVSESFQWILLMLYVFGGYSVECAQNYWVQQRRRKRQPPYPQEATRKFIEDVFLNVNTDEMWATIEGDTAMHKYARRQAFAWHTKSCLQGWVRKKNVTNGLAVPSRMVTQQYNALLNDIPFQIRPHALDDPRSDGYARVFLARWRRSFKSKWGRVKVQEVIPLDTKREKDFFFVFEPFFV